MIKSLFYFCAILCLTISCRSKDRLITTGLEYKIKEIDSASSVYIFYAELINSREAKDFQIVKIVSKKTQIHCSQSKLIKEGGIYKLNLYSAVPDFLIKNHLESIIFEGVSVGINEENVQHNLFTSHNIKGLCYNPSIIK